jgi:hypothetical protein
MKKLIAAFCISMIGLPTAWPDATTIQWQTPNPGFDMALRDMTDTPILAGMNWVIAMYIDDGGGGSTNMFGTTPQFGSTMDPFHPILNPTGTDMPVPGSIKGTVATFADGSYFELLSPVSDVPYDYSLIAGRQVYTVIYDTTDTNLVGATSFAITENATPFFMPFQNLPPNPELPTVIYDIGQTRDFDWIQVIPEPSSFAMLLGGLGVVAFVRRRRASQA